MLSWLFPESRICVSANGDVKVTGVLAPYHSRIAWFVKDLGLRKVTIRYGGRRFHFPRSIDVGTQQRLRNFFAAECPMAR